VLTGVTTEGHGFLLGFGGVTTYLRYMTGDGDRL